MAGNFWQSSHFEQWLMEKQDLLRERAEDLKVLSEDEYQKLMIFFTNFIQLICQDVNQGQSRTRMQVVATACVFFRRFYARRSLKDIDPFLLAPTCVVLASKVEEHGIMSTTKIGNTVTAALKKWPFLNQDVQNPLAMQEAEFFLLEILDCCLIVYHPYRPLMQMWNDLSYAYKDSKDLEEVKSVSWKVCNDSLKTDVSLLYPPHLIAVACLMVAAVFTNRDLKSWFSELSVDFEKVFEIQQMIFNMYSLWKSFKDIEQLPAIMEKMPKPAQTPSCHNGTQQPPQHMGRMMSDRSY
ncbi:hypothetical protein QR680_017260 [Steinernema hermaphroditum]|uniref:Cyclin-like domain-containing protein n=1 Tax=Steinernema hermaphroditum TaxID=289476 RepID=A0AA39HEG5_9BILA|nr:hypothetical protein QR680_017260 [Steinernema hermaphroditum]